MGDVLAETKELNLILQKTNSNKKDIELQISKIKNLRSLGADVKNRFSFYSEAYRTKDLFEYSQKIEKHIENVSITLYDTLSTLNSIDQNIIQLLFKVMTIVGGINNTQLDQNGKIRELNEVLKEVSSEATGQYSEIKKQLKVLIERTIIKEKERDIEDKDTKQKIDELLLDIEVQKEDFLRIDKVYKGLKEEFDIFKKSSLDLKGFQIIQSFVDINKTNISKISVIEAKLNLVSNRFNTVENSFDKIKKLEEQINKYSLSLNDFKHQLNDKISTADFKNRIKAFEESYELMYKKGFKTLNDELASKVSFTQYQERILKIEDVIENKSFEIKKGLELKIEKHKYQDDQLIVREELDRKLSIIRFEDNLKQVFETIEKKTDIVTFEEKITLVNDTVCSINEKYQKLTENHGYSIESLEKKIRRQQNRLIVLAIFFVMQFIIIITMYNKFG